MLNGPPQGPDRDFVPPNGRHTREVRTDFSGFKG
jgi:hypothetical protein